MDRSPGTKSTVRCFLFTILVLFSLYPSLGQYRVTPSLFKHRTFPEGLSGISFQDTLRVASTSADSIEQRGKSATTAILLSAVLPGAGQIYTGRYWKVPIILGFGGYFVRKWLKANDLYLSARGKYQQSVERGENGGQGSAQFLYERDFYRDERDKFAFYFALTYLLNIVDAYVGASLYNFEVTDNLGGGAALRLSVPIR
jgi:hypothetical protein